MLNNLFRNKNNGFSLIETVIGIALMLIVFVGFIAALQLGTRITGQSKAKAGATVLANEQMEMIRNLAYNDIGTIGGIPSGNIPQNESITLNNINYNRRTLIQYIDAPEDGLGENDENGVTTDYKRVKVEVSWSGKYYSGNPISLISDFMPKGIETNVGGGTLIIQVIDANSLPVPLAQVHIENDSTSVSVDVFTNTQGKVVFPGTPASGGYEITVTKSGYSTAQTYDDTPPNINPNPGHLLILEGETTQATFAIDKISSKEVYTVNPPAEEVWTDSFSDLSKIAASSSVIVANGKVRLDLPISSGYVVSTTISPAYLDSWKELSFSDSEPTDTDIKYRVLYNNEISWVAVPDADLAGNELGFDESPVDLSGLSTTTYSQIRLQANLSTNNTATTSELFNWQTKWNTTASPLPNITFNMRGAKTIGKDASENFIYKYDNNLTTDSSGFINIANLEWDTYDITTDGASIGYDISESCPPQPVSVLPNTSNATTLTLVPHAAHTLLALVKNASGALIAEASVHLYRDGYDQTQITSSCGQTFFTPLSSATDYNIEVTKTGYESFNLTNVEVNGQSRIEIIMNPI